MITGQPSTAKVTKSNPVPPPDTGSYLTKFVGSDIEVAIANWYYNRGWDVYNIQIPASDEYYPWFAHVSKFDATIGKTVWRPIGYVSNALPGAMDRRMRAAEFVDGGNRGDLWIVSLEGSSPLTYKGIRQVLHSPEAPKRWVTEETEIFRMV